VTEIHPVSDETRVTRPRAGASHPEYLDYFSEQSESYAAYRPGYPDDLFRFLASLVHCHRIAWDAGTGNGQAARGLARHFDQVIATDASERQLAASQPHPNVTYRQAIAGRTSLPDGSVDLATVAQALHWFDRDAYFTETVRVVRPGGVIAVWGYTWTRISPDLDAILARFADETLAEWWTPERRLVDTEYREITLPFPALATPVFTMREKWTLDQFLGYVGTWSAVRRYRVETGEDPIPSLGSRLREAWKEPESPRPLSWPIFLLACRVPPNRQRTD
jgi:SAM-dependent methyltransferase